MCSFQFASERDDEMEKFRTKSCGGGFCCKKRRGRIANCSFARTHDDDDVPRPLEVCAPACLALACPAAVRGNQPFSVPRRLALARSFARAGEDKCESVFFI